MYSFFRNLFLFFLLLNGFCFAQTVRITNRTQELIFDSEYLNEKKKVLIQLPSSYFDSQKGYPTLYVLDAQNLFDPVVGFVHYYSYLDSMPEAIVIGLANEEQETSFLNNGAAYRKFILKELLPYINDSYKPTGFRAILSNEESANFMASFLDKDTTYFNAYLAMSPGFTNETFEHLDTVFPVIDTTKALDSLSVPKQIHLNEQFYFGSGSDTREKLGSQAKLKQFFTERAPDYLHWKYEVFENRSNLTLPIDAIPKGIAFLFRDYRELDDNTWKKIEAGELDGITEIQLHYRRTERLLGVPVKINMGELLKLSQLYIDQKKYNLVVELGDFAMELYPETGESYFIAGKGQEGLKNYREALNYYELGHAKFKAPTRNKQDLAEEINRLKDMMAKIGK